MGRLIRTIFFVFAQGWGDVERGFKDRVEWAVDSLVLAGLFTNKYLLRVLCSEKVSRIHFCFFYGFVIKMTVTWMFFSVSCNDTVTDLISIANCTTVGSVWNCMASHWGLTHVYSHAWCCDYPQPGIRVRFVHDAEFILPHYCVWMIDFCVCQCEI